MDDMESLARILGKSYQEAKRAAVREEAGEYAKVLGRLLLGSYGSEGEGRLVQDESVQKWIRKAFIAGANFERGL